MHLTHTCEEDPTLQPPLPPNHRPKPSVQQHPPIPMLPTPVLHFGLACPQELGHDCASAVLAASAVSLTASGIPTCSELATPAHMHMSGSPLESPRQAKHEGTTARNKPTT
eukprot:2881913-Alexandrium_andersonii.AAC.1